MVAWDRVSLEQDERLTEDDRCCKSRQSHTTLCYSTSRIELLLKNEKLQVVMSWRSSRRSCLKCRRCSVGRRTFQTTIGSLTFLLLSFSPLLSRTHFTRNRRVQWIRAFIQTSTCEISNQTLGMLCHATTQGSHRLRPAWNRARVEASIPIAVFAGRKHFL